jgi:DNA (cytosine-5)-methyltransferase 1
MALNFIDLFAGAGGLSEGFIRVGYTPLAHIEMDKYACDTLKTCAAFHWLKANNQLQRADMTKGNCRKSCKE